MPRTGRGGSRQGSAGTAYSNRSDLRLVKPMAAPGQQYGAQGQQLRDQAAVPMAAAPGTAQPPPAGPASAPPQVVPLDAPSQNPNEHVLTGAPVGPGAGPEVLGPFAPVDADPALAKMSAYLPVLELVASQPDSSPDLRQLVRQIRASRPVV